MIYIYIFFWGTTSGWHTAWSPFGDGLQTHLAILAGYRASWALTLFSPATFYVFIHSIRECTLADLCQYATGSNQLDVLRFWTRLRQCLYTSSGHFDISNSETVFFLVQVILTLSTWLLVEAFLSASLYVSKRGAYWDRLCRDVVGRWLLRACTVAKRCILGL